MNGAIQNGTVTYDFERLMEGATLVSCSGIRRSGHRQHVETLARDDRAATGRAICRGAARFFSFWGGRSATSLQRALPKVL
jgi:hypothetical protein